MPYPWSPERRYYHIHVSKTGGTTLKVLLEKIVPRTGLTMCEADKLSFKLGDYFAEPEKLALDPCNVVSAEGRMNVIDGQFLRGRPYLMTFLPPDPPHHVAVEPRQKLLQ
jgi:hypothetical protein